MPTSGTDFFGRTFVDRDGDAELASNEYLIIHVGEALQMVQDMSMTYERDFNTVMGVGTEGVYFISGRGQGRMNVTRALTKEANQILQPYKGGSECGRVRGAVTVEGREGGECALGPSGKFSSNSAHIRAITLRASSGDLRVFDGAEYLLLNVKTG